MHCNKELSYPSIIPSVLCVLQHRLVMFLNVGVVDRRRCQDYPLLDIQQLYLIFFPFRNEVE